MPRRVNPGLPALLALLVAALLLPSLEALAQPGRPGQGDTRSIIDWFDGSYVRGEDDSDRRAERMAKAKAMEQAAERVGVYVRSDTFVKNEMLAASVVRTSTGEVKMRVVSQTPCAYDDPKEPRRMRCRLQIEAFYAVAPKVSGPREDPFLAPSGPLTVRLSSDKRVYTKGEEIILSVRSNKPAYVRIVTVNPAGEVIQLFPNEYRPDSRIGGGDKTHSIPDPRLDRFRLEVTHPPFGRERFILYASTAPLPNIKLSPLGLGLGRFEGTRGELDVRTRTIGVVPAESASAGTGAPAGSPEAKPADFYQTEIEVETRP